MITCKHAVDDILADQMSAELDAHLKTCDACRQMADEWQILKQHTSFDKTKVVPPPSVEFTIRSAAMERARQAASHRRIWRFVIPSVAALLLLSAVAGLSFQGGLIQDFSLAFGPRPVATTPVNNPVPAAQPRISQWDSAETDVGLLMLSMQLKNTGDAMASGTDDFLVHSIAQEFSAQSTYL